MASSCFPRQSRRRSVRVMSRLFVLAMMAGVGMGLFEFFFTWPSGRASLPGVRAEEKRPA